MKKINLLLISLVFVAISCKQYTEDLNTDPNNFQDAAGELIIGKAQLGWMQLAESNGARYAGIFMNQFTGQDRQYLTANTYSVAAANFDDTWDDAYVDGIAQAILTKKKAQKSGNKVLEGVAQIIQGAIAGEIAALFGDVPYEQVNNVDVYFSPKFDAQKDVLNNVQKLLDSAIANVGTTPVTDNFNGGRLSSSSTWAEIAHSLKARYYLIAKDYPNALIQAKEGISSPDGTLETVHTSTSGQRNLYYQFMVVQRDGYLGARDSYLFNIVNPSNTDVNRLIATPGESERFKYYFRGTSPNTRNGGIFARDNNFPLISYEEVKLIEAEAAHRTSDDGGARDAFNAVRSYLSTKYDASFPATSSSGETLLKEIIEEKYISLMGQLQPFHDIRRTNNILGVPAKVGNVIPQRFLYPQVVIDNNSNAPSTLPGLFDKTPVNQ